MRSLYICNDHKVMKEASVNFETMGQTVEDCSVIAKGVDSQR